MVVKQKVRHGYYICALLHYQGEQLWTVALCHRTVSVEGLKDQWEFVENLSHDDALEFLTHNKTRLIRATPGDIRKVIGGK